MSKKILSILLALTILIGVIAVIPVSVSAQETGIAEVGADIDVSETGITQAEAVQWIKDRGDEGWWQDVDGVYGCQCVDLIHAYYQYFGYGILSGNAYQYQWDHTPSGSNWYYSGSPIPGSVFVQSAADAGFSTGHVGLVYAVDDTFVYTVETNIVASSNGYAGERGYANARYNKRYRSRITTYINPVFDNPVSYANMDVNFWVDGKEQYSIDGIGNIQVYVDGQFQGSGTDFYQDVVVGKSYEVKINVTNYNYHYGGVDTYESGYSGLTGTTSSNGTKVRIVICKDDDGLQNIPNGYYKIVSIIDSAYGVDIDGDSIPAANGDNIQVYSTGTIPRPQDVFYLQNMNNGYYCIKQSNTDMAVGVYAANCNRWGNINIWDYNNSTDKKARQWKIRYDSSLEGYTLQAKCSGMYMTIDGGVTKDGYNIYQNIKSVIPKAQGWKLIRVLQSDMLTVSDVTIPDSATSVTPTFSIKVDGKTLTKDTDYTVDVTSDIPNGSGTVTVTGKGNYCGTVKKSFTITVEQQPTTPPEPVTYLLGDVDGDEEVGVIDATYIQRYDAGFNIPISDEDILARGDVDGDEEVTVLDATYIQRYDAGFDTPYPIGEVI